MKAKVVVQANLCKHLFSFSMLIFSCLHHQWFLSWFPFLKSMLFALVFMAFQQVSWNVRVLSPFLESTIVSPSKGLGLLVLHSTSSPLSPLYHFLLFGCCHFLCTSMIPTYFKSTLGYTYMVSLRCKYGDFYTMETF